MLIPDGGHQTDATVYPQDAQVTWTVEPQGIVTVSPSGFISAKKVGEATVTGTVTVADETATVDIHVNVVKSKLMTLNREEWWIEPQLGPDASHGACYLVASFDGVQDAPPEGATFTWALEGGGPKLLMPKDGSGQLQLDAYDSEITSPFARPWNIRWIYAPEVFGTDTSQIQWPVTQTSVLRMYYGGAHQLVECVIEIRDPNGA